jgi:Spy/CpxP family protein refolding chaperone
MNSFGKMAAGAGLGLALWALPVSSAFGQTDVMRAPGPHGAGRCGEKLVRALVLTPAQQSALDALQEETSEAIHPVMEKLHDLRDEVDEAASAPSADPCTVGAKAIEASGLHAQIQSVRKAAEAKFVATLSAEQKSRYDEYVGAHPDCLAVGGGFFFFKRLH